MRFVNPFSADFWIEPEPPSNVFHLDTPYAREHARANAQQAAQLLEEDREASRLERRVEVLRLIEQKRTEIYDLETEYELLGGVVR